MGSERCGAILLPPCVGPRARWCGGDAPPGDVDGDCSEISGVGGVGTSTATGFGGALSATTGGSGGTSGILLQQPIGR